MNKITKGLIVGGVGLCLLVGGTGSLALWNDAANVDAGPVESGEMSISATDGTWTDEIALWVPGDTTTYATTVEVTLAGDNLATEFSLDADSITGDADLIAALDVELALGSITGGGTAAPVAGKENTFALTSTTPATSTTLSIPVTVTVDFPADSVTGLVAQNESVDLGGISFAVSQVAP